MLSALLVTEPRALKSSQEGRMWSANCIVSSTDWRELIGYLLFDLAAKHALVDIIAFLPSELAYAIGDETTLALALVRRIRELPENCCMRDGRKWKRIPCVVLAERGLTYIPLSLGQEELSEELSMVQYSAHNDQLFERLMLKQLERIVAAYQKQVLASYRSVGILVDHEHGRLRVKWALQKRDPSGENEFYYAPADRRRLSEYVTVHREVMGIAHDAEIFEEMINDPATRERHLHRFFEQNPSFLMDAMQGVPISHRPRLANPKGWTPDFVLSSVAATPDGDRSVRVAELKGVHAPVLSEKLHRGFSHDVMSAINQVRDYGRILRECDSVNYDRIMETFGYIPASVRKAVVIGREPRTALDREVFERRMAEQPDIRIVSYDEILQAQHRQIRRGPWGTYL